MTVADSFHTLDAAPYGAYGMDPHRRIVFWNRSAERILGFTGRSRWWEGSATRRCSDLPEQPSALACGPGCLTVSLAEASDGRRPCRARCGCAARPARGSGST